MIERTIIFLEIGNKAVPFYRVPIIQYSTYMSNYNASNVNSSSLNSQAVNKNGDTTPRKIALTNFTTNTVR